MSSGNPSPSHTPPLSPVTSPSTRRKSGFMKRRTEKQLEKKQTKKDLNISDPISVQHHIHVTFDSTSNQFVGLPKEYNYMLQASGIGVDEIEKSPQEVLNVLAFSRRYTHSGGTAPFASPPSSPPPSRKLDQTETSSSSIPDLPIVKQELPKDQLNFDLRTLVSLTEKQKPTEIFTNLKKLGAGSFAEVYGADDIQNDRKVAIKKETITKKNIKYLISQITIQKSCQHPNIVDFLGCYVNEKELWICMEMMELGDLSMLLESMKKKNLKMQESFIAYIMKEILKGLNYIHALHRIHRDIKSSNILLGEKGQIKIADFGSAIQLTSNQLKRQTLIGTPYWMAPEVIQKTEYDSKVDIWSVGVLVKELAEREPPYQGVPLTKALFKISTTGVPPISDKKGRYSADMKHFFSMCTVQDPEARASTETLLEHTFLHTCSSIEEWVQFATNA